MRRAAAGTAPCSSPHCKNRTKDSRPRPPPYRRSRGTSDDRRARRLPAAPRARREAKAPAPVSRAILSRRPRRTLYRTARSRGPTGQGRKPPHASWDRSWPSDGKSRPRHRPRRCRSRRRVSPESGPATPLCGPRDARHKGSSLFQAASRGRRAHCPPRGPS